MTPSSAAAATSVPIPAVDRARFWAERHLCTLTTLRPDGGVHVVPVGATWDAEHRVARVITHRLSRKARNVAAAGPDGGRAALCQVDGSRWATLEGTALLFEDPALVAEAERRYTLRYHTPRANPQRAVIEITVDRVVGPYAPELG